MQQSHTVSCVIYRNRFIDSDGMDLLAVTHRFKLIHAGLKLRAYVPDIVLCNRRRKHDAELGTNFSMQFSQHRLLVTQTDSHLLVFTNSQIFIVCYVSLVPG